MNLAFGQHCAWGDAPGYGEYGLRPKVAKASVTSLSSGSLGGLRYTNCGESSIRDQTIMTENRDPSDAELLESFRGYLLVLASSNLDPRLRAKIDAADIVQQTMLRAHVALPELRDKRPEVMAAWLRVILSSVLADTVKHYRRDRRDIHLERSIAAEVDQSAAGLEGWLQAEQTSPSMGAARNEELLRLTQALARLRDDMREVIVLKHLKNMTLQQVADQTNRTTASVASLLRRGLAELRKTL
jgi:RNA polymerase sigma-70 factor (ECF subfamily)